MSIWVIAFPTTADTDSQKKRFMFMQGQSQGTLAEQRALSPLNLTLGELTNISPEFVFIEQIIIHYTGGNWSITESRKITGSKQSQTTAPSGIYLSSVSTDATLSGNGTAGSPLSVVTAYGVLSLGSGGSFTLADPTWVSTDFDTETLSSN